MSLLYQAYLFKRKKGASEKNKADLFETSEATVHYWGEDEDNNGSYVPAVGGVGADSFGAPPTTHALNRATVDPQL